MTDVELEQLASDLESDRVERKSSLSNRDKICEAICAFANDMPDHRKPGVLFVGLDDKGNAAGLPITDELLRNLAATRDDGNILPLPTMRVQKRTVRECDVAAVIVEPADFPPVRYKGQIWIRVGPRRAVASPEEERRLNEKRRARDLPFDLRPVGTASVNDLDRNLFMRDYLPSAMAHDVIEENDRSLEQQLMSLRFASNKPPHYPTVTGLLVVGKTPSDFIPGAYVQFLRVDGDELTCPILNQKEIHGPMPELLRRLDEVLDANISTATDIGAGPVEVRHPDYPIVALQQLTRNAVMHRDYETTNAPVRITWFSDRIEIQNPGGPFGQVTRTNFGSRDITDYRNPHLAEALKCLGFVQRFGIGIQMARKALRDIGSPDVDFRVEDTHILAIVRRRP